MTTRGSRPPAVSAAAPPVAALTMILAGATAAACSEPLKWFVLGLSVCCWRRPRLCHALHPGSAQAHCQSLRPGACSSDVARLRRVAALWRDARHGRARRRRVQLRGRRRLRLGWRARGLVVLVGGRRPLAAELLSKNAFVAFAAAFSHSFLRASCDPRAEPSSGERGRNRPARQPRRPGGRAGEPRRLLQLEHCSPTPRKGSATAASGGASSGASGCPSTPRSGTAACTVFTSQETLAALRMIAANPDAARALPPLDARVCDCCQKRKSLLWRVHTSGRCTNIHGGCLHGGHPRLRRSCRPLPRKAKPVRNGRLREKPVKQILIWTGVIYLIALMINWSVSWLGNHDQGQRLLGGTVQSAVAAQGDGQCVSPHKGDTPTAVCQAFCNEKFMKVVADPLACRHPLLTLTHRAHSTGSRSPVSVREQFHCKWCKCRACAFCPKGGEAIEEAAKTATLPPQHDGQDQRHRVFQRLRRLGAPSRHGGVQYFRLDHHCCRWCTLLCARGRHGHGASALPRAMAAWLARRGERRAAPADGNATAAPPADAVSNETPAGEAPAAEAAPAAAAAPAAEGDAAARRAPRRRLRRWRSPPPPRAPRRRRRRRRARTRTPSPRPGVDAAAEAPADEAPAEGGGTDADIDADIGVSEA